MFLNRHRLDLWVQTFTGGGNSAAATNFLARTSGLDATHVTAYTDLLNGLTTDGFFNASGGTLKLDILYIFATADQTTALLNLCQNLYNGTAESAPTFTADAGYTGGGAGQRVNTGYDNFSTPGLFVLDSASLFAWSNTSVGNGVEVVGNTSGDNSYIYTDQLNTFFGGCNTLGYNLTGPTADGKGLHCANRSGHTALQFYKNGLSIATDTTAAALPLAPTDIKFLGGVDGNNSNVQVMAGGLGASLSSTDQANLYARLHTYLQTIAGIP